jgi:hypothetical protein
MSLVVINRDPFFSSSRTLWYVLSREPAKCLIRHGYNQSVLASTAVVAINIDMYLSSQYPGVTHRESYYLLTRHHSSARKYYSLIISLSNLRES